MTPVPLGRFLMSDWVRCQMARPTMTNTSRNDCGGVATSASINSLLPNPFRFRQAGDHLREPLPQVLHERIADRAALPLRRHFDRLADLYHDPQRAMDCGLVR